MVRSEVAVKGNPTARRPLEATIDVIDTQGIAAVRLVEIAQAAETSKSSIYYFFGDREGLVTAAQRERALRTATVGLDLLEDFLKNCSSPEEWIEFALAMVTFMGDEGGRQRRRQRVEILGSSVSMPDVFEEILLVHDATAERFAGILERAQELGFMSTKLSAHAVSVWMTNLLTSRYVVENSGDPEQLAEWDAVHEKVMQFVLS